MTGSGQIRRLSAANAARPEKRSVHLQVERWRELKVIAAPTASTLDSLLQPAGWVERRRNPSSFFANASDCRPHRPPIDAGTPFARVLLRAERERFSSSADIHCARGRLGHRPVRRVSDCEVLAALVPERVLPFASGDSRKRGPGRVGFPAHDRGGAPKGERPAYLFGRGRACTSRRGNRGAPFGAPPPSFGEQR
jgi:hypothetical protein